MTQTLRARPKLSAASAGGTAAPVIGANAFS
jgi:hypothetical protein